MTQHQTSRTLVKSAPELWAECSDAASLARHLGAFGEIRITKLEPESAVAWEGTAARGTVTLEPSGWGTRVTLTLVEEAVAGQPVAEQPVAEEPVAAPDEEPVAVVQDPPTAVVEEPPTTAVEEVPAAAVDAAPTTPVEEVPEAAAPEERNGRFARLFGRLRRRPAVALEEEAAADPEPVVEPEPEPELDAAPAPPAAAAPDSEVALTAALDSLGRAHHRPYSRA